MKRFVVDPGVFVSGLVSAKGMPPDQVQRAVVNELITAVACPRLLAELDEVLSRPKFRRWVTQEVADEYVAHQWAPSCMESASERRGTRPMYCPGGLLARR